MSDPLSDIDSDDSFLDFKCPYCGEVNSFPTTAAHTLQDCASCMEPVIVPEAGAQTAGRLPLPMSTPRLLLRRFHPNDFVKLLETEAQDETSALPINETNVDQWIEQQRAARFTRGESGAYLALEFAETRELVGYLWIHYSEPTHHTAGFELTVNSLGQGLGIGLEAARAALNFAFEGLCVRRVALSCPSADSAMRQMLEQAGMRQEGELLKSWFDGTDWVDMSLYALLKEERAAGA